MGRWGGRKASVPGPYVFISFTMPYGMLKTVDSMAAKEKKSRAEILRMLITEGLNVYESRKGKVKNE
jgi:metal-responsive CopG/Arc/MetJ family transcriptional regulator